jgi:hypothetical protein
VKSFLHELSVVSLSGIFTAFVLSGVPLAPAAAQSAPSQAQPVPKPAPSPQVVAFDRFMKQSSPVCQTQSSKRCIDAGWKLADRDSDGTLTLQELQSVRAQVGDWLAWKEGIQPRDKANLAMGLWVVDSAGLPNLFASYDTNGDGRLTQAELLADVKLDERPLGKVLTDEKSVDRQRFSQRLGPLSKLAESLMQPRPAPGATPAPRAPVQSQPLQPAR